jgi:mannonate dehydratase
VYDYTTLITEQLIDYIRMPPARRGYYPPSESSMASVYHILPISRGYRSSPVNMAAALHFDTAINNFGIQEYALSELVNEASDNIIPAGISVYK